MISTAAAPSEICEDEAAVTSPSSTKHGGSWASFSYVEPARTPSSKVSRPSPAGSPSSVPATATLSSMRARRVASGRISRSKRPSSMARAARSWERRANRSISSRVMSQRRAISSAQRPWWMKSKRPCTVGP